MITHYLGDQEVTAYAKDFAGRLASLRPEIFPTVWSPIGKSGDKMLRVVAQELGKILSQQLRDNASTAQELSKLFSSIQIVELFFNKERREISVGARSTNDDLKCANVLVLDSSIHSGSSMLAAVRHAFKHGAASVISYTLTVKKSSSFLPHYFGVVVGDHDRVLFQLDGIPNNRLFTKKYNPIGCFRRITETDSDHPCAMLKVGVPSIDRISLGDLYYEHRANGYDVIVVEDQDKIAGYLKIKAHPKKQLQLDVVAADESYKGKGIGGALIRYAETMGRANCCTHIELWSIEDKIELYRRFGFQLTDEMINAGGGERYCLMKKRLLYHFDINDGDE